eukprot:3189512-Prymnesium_polylepis.1
MEKAATEAARWQRELDARATAEQPPAEKRQRTREARPYDEYSVEEFLRQESWLWTRRRAELAADAAVSAATAHTHAHQPASVLTLC